jgi:hypothetical protein
MSLQQRLVARGLLLAAFCSVGALAHAESITFKTHMTTAQEVPPKTGGGEGDVTATLDTVTNKLSYSVTYSGLSGDATAAHFHGPAPAGVNAGVTVPMKTPIMSPIMGEATLTPEQASDLMAGKWYFNVHTAANPSGEIRGQMIH